MNELEKSWNDEDLAIEAVALAERRHQRGIRNVAEGHDDGVDLLGFDDVSQRSARDDRNLEVVGTEHGIGVDDDDGFQAQFGELRDALHQFCGDHPASDDGCSAS